MSLSPADMATERTIAAPTALSRRNPVGQRLGYGHPGAPFARQRHPSGGSTGTKSYIGGLATMANPEGRCSPMALPRMLACVS
jgi:hypothetical protein